MLLFTVGHSSVLSGLVCVCDRQCEVRQCELIETTQTAPSTERRLDMKNESWLYSETVAKDRGSWVGTYYERSNRESWAVDPGFKAYIKDL